MARSKAQSAATGQGNGGKGAIKPRQPGKQAVKMALQVQHNKKVLLEALEKSLGVVTTACKSAGLDRTTHYNYVNSDAEYAAAVDELSDVALDFAESKLHRQIDKGDTTATIFYLKTKGKKRGYIERSELTGKDGESLLPQQFTVKVIEGKKDANDSGNKA